MGTQFNKICETNKLNIQRLDCTKFETIIKAVTTIDLHLSRHNCTTKLASDVKYIFRKNPLHVYFV